MSALAAAGYRVFPVNPLQSARFRQRHQVSGAKSDAGDAHVLADMVRTDFHQLREAALGQIRDPAAAPALAEALKIPNQKLRQTAAEALAQVKGPAAAPALTEALKDAD